MAAHDDVEKVARAIYEASIPKHGRNYVPFDELDSHGYEHAYDIATLQALAAIDAMQGDGWRDIASAPPEVKNGSDVLVLNDRGMFVAAFDKDWGDDGWWLVSDGRDHERPLRGSEPTHYRPLPPPPGEKP